MTTDTPSALTQAEFETMLTRASEAGVRSYVAAHPAPEPAVTSPKTNPEAPMSQGMLEGTVRTLDSLGGLNIPFGSVLVGAIPGVIAGDVIDGLVPPRTATGEVNWLNPGLKAGAAWIGVQYGRAFLGSTGAMFFAGTLALQAMSQLLPLDKIVAQIVGVFQRKETSAATPTAAAANAWLGQAFKPNTQQGGYWS